MTQIQDVSILLAILLVGVASGRRLSYPDDAADEAAEGPIELPEARRICASLCMAGLGGRPCGESCLAIQPAEFDLQSADSNGTAVAAASPLPRRDVCPLLCQYELGDPLCDCPPQLATFDSIFFKIDFEHICAFFCVQHRYRIYGCPLCEEYKEQHSLYSLDFLRRKRNRDGVDWEAWCREKCSIGDGGVACNCDILPLSLPVQIPELQIIPKTKE